MMFGWRAQVRDNFEINGVTLLIANVFGNGRAEVLLADGSWQTVEDGEAFPSNAGLPLPADALEALTAALAKHQGNAFPSQAEVAVLREVLAKEQERVDTLFTATVHTIHGRPE